MGSSKHISITHLRSLTFTFNMSTLVQDLVLYQYYRIKNYFLRSLTDKLIKPNWLISPNPWNYPMVIGNQSTMKQAKQIQVYLCQLAFRPQCLFTIKRRKEMRYFCIEKGALSWHSLTANKYCLDFMNLCCFYQQEV